MQECATNTTPTLGTATFGGGKGIAEWGNSGTKEATRLVDLCFDAGLTMFDSADMYSDGAAESILGAAIKGRRDRVLISTKATFRTGPINWVDQRPNVAIVIIGATGWVLTPTQIALLYAASAEPRIYPHWHQAQFAERNTFPTSLTRGWPSGREWEI